MPPCSPACARQAAGAARLVRMGGFDGVFARHGRRGADQRHLYPHGGSGGRRGGVAACGGGLADRTQSRRPRRAGVRRAALRGLSAARAGVFALAVHLGGRAGSAGADETGFLARAGGRGGGGVRALWHIGRGARGAAGRPGAGLLPGLAGGAHAGHRLWRPGRGGRAGAGGRRLDPRDGGAGAHRLPAGRKRDHGGAGGA